MLQMWIGGRAKNRLPTRNIHYATRRVFSFLQYNYISFFLPSSFSLHITFAPLNFSLGPSSSSVHTFFAPYIFFLELSSPKNDALEQPLE